MNYSCLSKTVHYCTACINGEFGINRSNYAHLIPSPAKHNRGVEECYGDLWSFGRIACAKKLNILAGYGPKSRRWTLHTIYELKRVQERVLFEALTYIVYIMERYSFCVVCTYKKTIENFEEN